MPGRPNLPHLPSVLSYLTQGNASADCICILPRAISAHPARTNTKVEIRFAGYYAINFNQLISTTTSTDTHT
jgi:hypothetical protein